MVHRSLFVSSGHKEDAWTHITNPAERRRIQNRIAQRTRRQKIRDRKLHAAKEHTGPLLPCEVSLWLDSCQIEYTHSRDHTSARRSRFSSKRSPSLQLEPTLQLASINNATEARPEVEDQSENQRHPALLSTSCPTTLRSTDQAYQCGCEKESPLYEGYAATIGSQGSCVPCEHSGRHVIFDVNLTAVDGRVFNKVRQMPKGCTI